MVNKSNILMTARTFRYGGFCLVLWPISDDDDVGLYVLGCRVDILGTNCTRYLTTGPWIHRSMYRTLRLHTLESVTSVQRTGIVTELRDLRWCCKLRFDCVA